MFAVFGLGPSEMIVLFLIGLLLVGGPILAVVVALSLVRRSEGGRSPEGVAELRTEVDRLREEIERLKKGSA